MRTRQATVNKLNNEYLYNVTTKESFEEYYKYQSDEITDDIKRIIINDLNNIDKTIFLVYVDKGNMRDTAKVFGVSIGTIHKRISKIRNYIKIRLDDYEYTN